MSQNLLPYIKIYYDSLLSQLMESKKYRKNTSLLTSMMNLKSNVRHDIIQKAALVTSNIPKNIFEDLLSKQYVQNLDHEVGYAITARGVHYYEETSGSYSVEELITYIDDKFFIINKADTRLSDKEKVIILFFIGIRAYSEKSVLDLKMDKRYLEDIETMLIDCYNFLLNEQIIKTLEKEDLFGKSGNEHPVSNIIRHTDALPKKTKGLFKAPGNQKYYINLSKNEELNLPYFSYLMWQILGNDYPISKITTVIEFLKEFGYRPTTGRIFDVNKHVYQHPKYDKQIEDAIYQYYDMRNSWNKTAKK